MGSPGFDAEPSALTAQPTNLRRSSRDERQRGTSVLVGRAARSASDERRRDPPRTAASPYAMGSPGFDDARAFGPRLLNQRTPPLVEQRGAPATSDVETPQEPRPPHAKGSPVSTTLEPSALTAQPTTATTVGRAARSASDERRRDPASTTPAVRQGLTGFRRRSSPRPALLNHEPPSVESTRAPARNGCRDPGDVPAHLPYAQKLRGSTRMGGAAPTRDLWARPTATRHEELP